MIRKAKYSGGFYEESQIGLKYEIKEFWPKIDGKDKKIKYGIVPHAGYMYSGKCAAEVISRLDPKTKTVIILGTNHTRWDFSCTTKQDFETPLGVMINNKELTQKFVEKGIVINDIIHNAEHSIEVQIPLIQTVSKEIQLVPILVGSDWEKTSEIISEIIKGKKQISLIVSADFTHYGPNYNYEMFGEEAIEKVTEIDKKVLDKITNCDSEGFIKIVEEYGLTICGKYPIACLLNILKNKKGKIVSHYNSSEISGQKRNFVDYAGVIF